MIVVALALMDITYEVGVKYINRVKAQCINGLELITLIYDRLSIGFYLLPLPLIIKVHVPVMIRDIVIIIWEDHVYYQESLVIYNNIIYKGLIIYVT